MPLGDAGGFHDATERVDINLGEPTPSCFGRTGFPLEMSIGEAVEMAIPIAIAVAVAVAVTMAIPIVVIRRDVSVTADDRTMPVGVGGGRGSVGAGQPGVDRRDGLFPGASTRPVADFGLAGAQQGTAAPDRDADDLIGDRDPLDESAAMLSTRVREQEPAPESDPTVGGK